MVGSSSLSVDGAQLVVTLSMPVEPKSPAPVSLPPPPASLKASGGAIPVASAPLTAAAIVAKGAPAVSAAKGATPASVAATPAAAAPAPAQAKNEPSAATQTLRQLLESMKATEEFKALSPVIANISLMITTGQLLQA